MDYTTQCFHCKERFVARFSVSLSNYSQELCNKTATTISPNQVVQTCFSEYSTLETKDGISKQSDYMIVNALYLSIPVLKNEVENVLLNDTELLASEKVSKNKNIPECRSTGRAPKPSKSCTSLINLRNNHPTLFWNLIWLFGQLELDPQLLALPTSSKEFGQKTKILPFQSEPAKNSRSIIGQIENGEIKQNLEQRFETEFKTCAVSKDSTFLQ